MNYKVRFLFWLPVLLAIIACSTVTPLLQATPTLPPLPKYSSGKPTYTPSPTTTPIPSPTNTPTSTLPSPSPTPLSTSTQTPTSLPLLTQRSIFENLWSIVDDTYVYPDFNGLDWNAIHQEYRQKISAGLTNAQFYLAMNEVINQLGDDHSFFLDPQQVAEQNADYLGTYDYVGIGVLVSAVPERQRAVILSVFSDSPAEAAGLQPRDSILSVDGTPILDEDGFLRDIVRGPEGTTITVAVQTPGDGCPFGSADNIP